MNQVQRTIGKCKIVKNEFDEYVVKCWDTQDKRYQEVDYYACDMIDAKATMHAMLKNQEIIRVLLRNTA